MIRKPAPDGLFMPLANQRAREALVEAIGSAWLDDQSIPRRLDSLAEQLGVSRVLEKPLSAVARSEVGASQAKDGRNRVAQRSSHGNVDAMLVPAGGTYTIILNEKSTPARRRYSMAHELAHLVTERHSGESPRQNSTRFRQQSNEHSDREVERFCDQIAAEILMPADRFIESAGRLSFSLSSLPSLANLYQTSITSTAIRLAELLPGPGLLVRWSRIRGGPLVPSWQVRNEQDGPQVDGISRFGRRRGEVFEGAREAWKDAKCHLTWESLRVRTMKASQRYVGSHEYETESVGFGSGQNRFVLSLTYLDRRLAPEPN